MNYEAALAPLDMRYCPARSKRWRTTDRGGAMSQGARLEAGIV